MAKHVLQHPEPPTWCVNCGTFGEWCDDYDCTSEPGGRFDSNQPENWQRMYAEIFGECAEEPRDA